MTYSEELAFKIRSVCASYKGQHEWVNDVIDLIIVNAKELIMNFPSDDILMGIEVSFVCEEHHDGYIIELFLDYIEPKYNGLCVRLSDFGIDITNNDADEYGYWDINSDKSIQILASEVYEELKKLL